MEGKAYKQAGAGRMGVLQGMEPIVPMVLVDGRVRGDMWVKRVVMEGPTDEREVELGVQVVGAGFVRGQRNVMERLRGASVVVLLGVGIEGGEARLWPIFSGRVSEIWQTLDGKRDQWTVVGRCDWSRRLDDGADGVTDAGGLLGELGVMNREGIVDERAVRGSTIRGALKEICEGLGVVVEREMSWVGQAVRERRRIGGGKLGRGVSLSGGVLSDEAGWVNALRGRVSEREPVKMIAQMSGQEVEATFELRAGWSAGDEGKADGEYVKSTSGDFDAVMNVYRAWVLNEDGANGEQAYELGALFDESVGRLGGAVRFAGCLTRDEAGRSLGVVVEMSVDGGVQWTRYPGLVTVMTDRGGVYLEDDALPVAFFEAAKTGQAKVRVTATVKSGWPTRCVRWVGNPFAGRFAERRFDVSDRFAWRRVDATSRYAQQVFSGQRKADETDDRTTMETWLAAQATADQVSEVRIRMTEPMVGLRVGDRLRMIEGWEIGASVMEPAIGSRDVVLWRIEHRWEEPTGSELVWRVH